MNLRPATLHDCLSLADRLRPCDLTEIAKGSGRRPVDVLMESVRDSSFCQAITTDDDLVVALWGVVPLNPDSGAIWMLGSPEIASVSLPFLRACEPSVASQLEVYPKLVCASWRGNRLHHRWLLWLGFVQIGNHDEFHIFQRHV